MVSTFYSAELSWIRHRIPILIPFLRWTVTSADAVTAISTATATVVKRFGAIEVHVVPLPAGVPGERLVAAKAVAASGTSRPGDGGIPPEVLFVGRLVERKGVEVLVRAVARLAPHRPIRLKVVGDGEWRGRIMQVVEELSADEFVELAGRVTEEELAEAYQSADVFALPAVFDSKGDTEGLGVVLIEALCAGIPVVGANAGGIPDIVVDGKTGWLVPPGDDEELARVLAEVLDSPGEARRRVQAGIEHVRARFAPDRVAEAYVRCYQTAVSRRSRGRTGDSRS